MKKITVVTGIFYPDIGGPPTYLNNLLLRLHKDGYLIKVITFGDEKGDIDYPFSIYRISRKRSNLVKIFKMIKVILKTSKNTDLFYVNDYGIPNYIVSFFVKKPIIMKIVGDFAWENSITRGLTNVTIDEFQTIKGNFKINFLKKLQQLYTKNALKIITPSNYLKKVISNWGVKPENIEVIYNSVKVSKILNKENNNNGFKLVTVCRLAKWKGVDSLIKAVDTLNKCNENISLDIVGTGPMMNDLIKLRDSLNCKNNIRFLGNKKPIEVRKIMNKANAFILNSCYEGLSHVILEAMMEKLPVLASYKGGNIELVENNRGILFEYNNIADICNSIMKMKNSDSLLYSTNSYDFVMKNCCFEKMYKNTKKVLNEFL